jgi:hypothetical protein
MLAAGAVMSPRFMDFEEGLATSPREKPKADRYRAWLSI